MTLEEAVARVPDVLKEKLHERLRGNFREVVRYQPKPIASAGAEAVPVPDESELAMDDDEDDDD